MTHRWMSIDDRATRVLLVRVDRDGHACSGASDADERFATELAAEIGDGRAGLVLVDGPLAPDRLRRLAAVVQAHGGRVGVVLPHGRRAAPGSAPGEIIVAGRTALLLPRDAASPARARDRRARVADVLGALALAVLSAPLWIALAAIIPLESRGPLLFSHVRIGRGGRRFRMWKFRTMRVGADPYARSPDDVHPGVTRLGRLLRPAGLDELPQLLNVLRGEMRLVGPRPEMPFVVDTYTALERARLDVPPGLTGLWQLSGDRSRPIHAQLEYDFIYIASRSLMLDARLVGRTAVHVVRALGRRFSVRRVPRSSEPVAREPLANELLAADRARSA